MKQCVLFLTHTVADPVRAELRRLVDEGISDNTFVALDTRSSSPPDLLPAKRMFTFDSSQFNRWGYATFGPKMVPGHTHFPLLRFYEQNEDYDYYWLIEHDVRFSGSWGTFFAACDRISADCLTCHVRTHRDEPRWYWWNSLEHRHHFIDLESRIRSLNVAYRLSRAAIVAIIGWHRDGWAGHQEVLIPTLLHEHGFRVVDLGGDGPFVPRGNRNRFYTSYSTASGNLRYLGSIRYRPASRTAGRRAGVLYHPVKPVGTFKPDGFGQLVWGTLRQIKNHLMWRATRHLRVPRV